MSKPVLCDSQTPTASAGTLAISLSRTASASACVWPTMILVAQMMPTASGSRPLRSSAGIEIPALLRHQRQPLAGAEHMVDEPGRGLDTPRRSASLDQHRGALRRRRHAERPLHLEELAHVIDRPHLAGIRHDAAFRVPHEGVRIDAGPQRLADRDELLHPVVAPAMGHQLVETVILGIGPALRRDDVEGDPPVGDVVERVQQTRHEKRVHEGGRVGQPEAQMRGDPRHGRNPRAHIHPRPGDTTAHGGLDRPLVRVRDARAVPEENQVEQAALGDAGSVLEQPNIGVVLADPGSGRPPRGLDLGPGHVDGKVHLWPGHRERRLAMRDQCLIADAG